MEVSANPAPAPAAVEDEHQQALLAAVEEFLVRTQDYQVATATTTPSAADQRPATNSETLPRIDRTLESPDGRPPSAQPKPPVDKAYANTRMTLGNKVTARSSP